MIIVCAAGFCRVALTPTLSPYTAVKRRQGKIFMQNTSKSQSQIVGKHPPLTEALQINPVHQIEILALVWMLPCQQEMAI